MASEGEKAVNFHLSFVSDELTDDLVPYENLVEIGPFAPYISKKDGQIMYICGPTKVAIIVEMRDDIDIVDLQTQACMFMSKLLQNISEVGFPGDHDDGGNMNMMSNMTIDESIDDMMTDNIVINGTESKEQKEDKTQIVPPSTKSIFPINDSLCELRQRIILDSELKESRNIMNILKQRQCNVNSNRKVQCAASLKYRIPKNYCQRINVGHRAFCGKFSNDGNSFCCASQNDKITLYDTSTWNIIKTIEAREVGWSVIDVDYSDDQRFIMYSSWSEYLNLCNVYGDFELHETLNFDVGEGTCMFSVKFSPQNRHILAGMNNGRTCIYDIETRQKLFLNDNAHLADINSVCYLDDTGNVYITASDDCTCKIWDQRIPNNNNNIINNTCVGGFVGHRQGLTCVRSRGDNRYLLTNGKDQCMKLWDLRKISTVTGVESYARIDNSFDYRWHRHQNLSQHRIHEDQSVMSYYDHVVQETLIRCDFSPIATTGGQYVYSGSADGSVYIYNILTGKREAKLDNHFGVVRDVAWHPYEPLIVSSSWDGSLRQFTSNDVVEVKETTEQEDDAMMLY